MTRQLVIFIISLVALGGGLVAAAATAAERDAHLRGYVDATTTPDLPYRLPRIGVNAELRQYTPDELATQFDLMRQAHITWVRQPFAWDEIEPEPGTFDWSAWDRIVEAIAAYPDLRLVAVLVNTPDWARRDPAAESLMTPPDDPADYANFAAAVASRYGAVIDHYQIWDEPNLSAAWGGGEPRAADYTAMLRAAYHAIHANDADATVIAAALAPTTETGPLNISDWLYLRDLYALGAGDFMDAVAGKPYGFDLSPADRAVAQEILSFSRLVGLREVMTAAGAGTTALWGSQWGWNSLPDDWPGEPSIWGEATAQQQIDYTLTALDRADREWPWLGGLILQHWQPDAPPDDPIWGFALVNQNDEPTPLLEALIVREPLDAAHDGLYRMTTAHAQYSGVWTFSDLGADIGFIGDSRLQFDFFGSDLALRLREDDYVGYLYPTINGQPANAVPRDAEGNAYIILTSRSGQPELVTVPVARDLPPGTHTLNLITDRGYDRWALAGFAVSSGNLAAPYNRQITLALVAAAVAGVSTLVSGWLVPWRRVLRPFGAVGRRLNDVTELGISIVTSLALLAGMLLTFGDAMPNLLRREPVQLGLALVTGGVIYLQPHVLLVIAAALVLFVLVYHRLDLGLMLVILYAPFFLFPVELYQFAFPMSELVMLITAAAWVGRSLADWGRRRQASVSQHPPPAQFSRWQTLDYAVVAWLLLGVVSLSWAQLRGIALTELRVLIIEPILFYVVFRTLPRDGKLWLRLVDALLLAGFFVAVIGLFLFVQGAGIITAEAGTPRLASVYGSPNNVGLFLGRCIPFALAFALLPLDRRRRIAAACLLLPMLLAAALTLSAGAIFLGIPAAVVVVLLLAWGRRARLPLIGLAAAGAAGFAVALQSARFARLLDPSEGTNFYRIRVWQSALNMIRDYPLTGLGLDQFLYAFRGHYIFPDAWEEPNLSHPHNFILDFWVRLGILGVVWFVWVQWLFWRALVRTYRVIDRAAQPLQFALVVGTMGSMVNLLVHGLVDNSVYVQDLSFVFVLLLGLAAALPEHESY